VQCWGYNSDGQLGNNSTTSSLTPVPVQGLAAGVTAIAASLRHACAIVNGAVQCWGDNSDGELGYGGAGTKALTPVPVQGLSSPVSAVAAGVTHTCAVVNGAALCWGDNSSGALGDGTYHSAPTPVQVQGLTSGVTAVSAGDGFSCADVNGAARCWGNNGSGGVGNGSSNYSLTPVPVQGLGSGVTAVAESYTHSVCALVNGGVQCWGYNANGQLGDNSTINSPVPVPVAFP
jgi:alpha-tubulin suppressor-like RCC1 family protein